MIPVFGLTPAKYSNGVRGSLNEPSYYKLLLIPFEHTKQLRYFRKYYIHTYIVVLSTYLTSYFHCLTECLFVPHSSPLRPPPVNLPLHGYVDLFLISLSLHTLPSLSLFNRKVQNRSMSYFATLKDKSLKKNMFVSKNIIFDHFGKRNLCKFHLFRLYLCRSSTYVV